MSAREIWTLTRVRTPLDALRGAHERSSAAQLEGQEEARVDSVAKNFTGAH